MSQLAYLKKRLQFKKKVVFYKAIRSPRPLSAHKSNNEDY